VILASVLFVLGFTTVFVGLGAGASYFGQLIQSYKRELEIAAGLVIILFGLHFVGIFRVAMFYADTRYHGSHPHGVSYIGAYVIGLAFAFGWTPCIGPVLATVLALAANEGSLATGVKLLFVYSLGLGIPFILAAVAVQPFLSFMQRFRRHLDKVEKVMGVVLIVTGLLFLDTSPVREWLIMHLPGLFTGRVLGLLLQLLGVIVIFGGAQWARSGLTADSQLSDQFANVAGVVLLAFGVVLFGGSVNGLGQWMLENFPGLAQIEQMVTPKDLGTEIMQRGTGR
jgi:cytochrome c-type biogenesis protein